VVGDATVSTPPVALLHQWLSQIDASASGGKRKDEVVTSSPVVRFLISQVGQPNNSGYAQQRGRPTLPLLPGVPRDGALEDYFSWQKRRYTGAVENTGVLDKACNMLRKQLFDVEALYQDTTTEELVQLGIPRGLAKALIRDVEFFLCSYVKQA